jgi:hypothetical protein
MLALLAATMASPAFAGQGTAPVPAPNGRTLGHVFIIMMENHGAAQIIGNANAPFINQYMTEVNTATNYYAVAHPSLTNYLEIVGGSNFGIQNDNSPNWHNSSCSPNLATGITSTEAVGAPICPISGTGADAATPAVDTTNETAGPPGLLNIDGVKSFPAASGTLGISIADQLVAVGKTWKSYQEDLAVSGADGLNNGAFAYSNLTNFAAISNNAYNGANQVSSKGVVALYAVKHNPFAYFKSVQEGTGAIGLANVVGLDQFYQDVAAGTVPNLSFIAPNQCHDQHGKSGEDQECNYDADDNGTQVGLNPGLIAAGDAQVQKLVTAIHKSSLWNYGSNAIVVVWDENDYYVSPETNKVVITVDTNYGKTAKVSTKYYNHFNLLKTLEGVFGLPCLNHACDAGVTTMADMFSGQ